jgi:hypothetical protein
MHLGFFLPWLEKNRPILHYQTVRAVKIRLPADVAAGVELFPGGDGGGFPDLVGGVEESSVNLVGWR